MVYSDSSPVSRARSARTKAVSTIRSKGQALVEGTAALVIQVAVFVLMVALGINAFFLTQWSAKVNLVASEAAKVVAINKYWLGMARPDYQPTVTQGKARQVAERLCQQLGLPAPTVTFPDVPSDDAGDYINADKNSLLDQSSVSALTVLRLTLCFGLVA